MSLPIPDLDNKSFSQLVDEARKLIPGYSSEWTDHNLSDPGITFIDLFAWLSEIALYRTNLVTESHRLKYLKLLGIKPRPATQARVDLTFIPDKEQTLPKGTSVWTKIDDKKIYFYIEEEIDIQAATLEKIVVDERTSGIYNRSLSNLDEKRDLFFAPFGNEIQNGCAMYLGFVFNNKVPDAINFVCYIYEKDLIEIKKHETGLDYRIENTGLKWEISVKSSDPLKCGWKQILTKDMKDETKGFRRNGKITINIPEDWTSCNPFPGLFNDKFFWLRCVVEDAFYEYPPRIENLRLNTVSAVHGQKVKNENSAFISNGLPFQVFELKKTPIVDNTLKLSIEEEWVEVNDFKISGPYDRHFILDMNDGDIKLGNGYKGRILPKGSIIKLMKYSIADCDEWISEGLPDQILNLNKTPASGLPFKLFVEEDKWTEVDDFEGSKPADKHFILNRINKEIKFGNGNKGKIPPRDSTLKLTKFSENGSEKWISNGLPDQIFMLQEVSPTPGVIFKIFFEDNEWAEAADFEGSGPSDKHYLLNKEKGEIKFGDGLMGLVPPQGTIIRVPEYIKGGGEEGNLLPECKWETDDYNGQIINYLASTGGKEAQTIDETIEDFCRDLKIPYTAVTLQDFEQLAMSTPGLRISSAKAIPDYRPKQNSNDKELEESRGSVTVIIIPYTPLEDLKIPPEPSEDFKKAVCAHLDKHRILGTEIHVISPIYTKVIANARIVPKNASLDDDLIRNKIIEKLKLFLHPVKGGVNEKGWPIGRSVYLSDIYNLIEKIKGVDCVLRLSISGDQNASTDSDGNLILNKLSSVYSGAHNVEIFREKNQCFKRGDSYSGKQL